MRRILINCALVITTAVAAVQAVAQTPSTNTSNLNTSNAGSPNLNSLNGTSSGRPSDGKSPAPAPIPYVTSIDYPEAPVGAVIQLTVGGTSLNPGDEQKYRLQICGITTRYTVLNSNLVAAVVPRVRSAALTAGKPFPDEVIFFLESHGGEPYPFTVIPPSIHRGAQVEIDGVRRQENNNYYDISFNDKIPLDLWGKVVITFDNKPVETVVKMAPQMFTVALPPGLPAFGAYQVKAEVGQMETSGFQFTIPAPSPTPTPAPSPTPLAVNESAWRLSTSVAVVSFLLTLAGLATAVYFYRTLRRVQESAKTKVWIQPPVEELHLPEELPAELVEACRAGECVLYAGAGLSSSSGLPTWKEFVHSLLEWARGQGYISESEEVSFHSEVDGGQSDPVADSVVSRLKTEQDKARLDQYLREVFLKPSSPSDLHSLFWRINLSAVLTANLDNLMEKSYKARPDQVFTPRDTEALLACLTRRDFFILKLYGSLDSPGTAILTSAQYEDEITGNRMFSQFMQTLFFSRTLLFAGASLEGIESYLRGISLPRGAGRRHYAIVAVTDNARRSKADLLERRYGITVLPFTPGEAYEDLGEFLRKLAEAAVPGAGRGAAGGYMTSRLKRLSLRDIGPFESLDLDFDSKWQVFLGDNGVGKSTVLKAIALALCGDKAEPFAWRMIKAGRPFGEITLETDNKTSYVTTIKRGKNPGEAELVSTTARPLEALLLPISHVA